MTVATIHTDLAETFRENLLRIRKSRGLTQVAFAELVGMDQTYISRLERGECSPQLKTLQQLAERLHVKASELIEEYSA